MKLRLAVVAAAMLGSASVGQAAGVKLVTIATVDHANLGGYKAVMPNGWQQKFQFIPGAAPPPSKDWKQNFFFLNSAVPAISSVPYPSTVPPLVYLTRLGKTRPTGPITILSKVPLPANVQVTQLDCNLPNYAVTPIAYNGCPSLDVTITPTKDFPNKLLVLVTKRGRAQGGGALVGSQTLNTPEAVTQLELENIAYAVTEAVETSEQFAKFYAFSAEIAVDSIKNEAQLVEQEIVNAINQFKMDNAFKEAEDEIKAALNVEKANVQYFFSTVKTDVDAHKSQIQQLKSD
jgi:hypothetical protein